jgi:hypothetical protein
MIEASSFAILNDTKTGAKVASLKVGIADLEIKIT